jgi:hypothetical protein
VAAASPVNESLTQLLSSRSLPPLPAREAWVNREALPVAVGRDGKLVAAVYLEPRARRSYYAVVRWGVATDAGVVLEEEQDTGWVADPYTRPQRSDPALRPAALWTTLWRAGWVAFVCGVADARVRELRLEVGGRTVIESPAAPSGSFVVVALVANQPRTVRLEALGPTLEREWVDFGPRMPDLD